MFLYQQVSERKNNKEDHRLWTALRFGQKEALAELFQRHHVQLYNYGVKMVSDCELVNDAIQKLFLNLWRRHDQISEAKSVKAYLLSSLRRLIMEQVQASKARSRRNRFYMVEKEETFFSVEDLLIRKEVAKEQHQRLQKAIDELTPRQKEAVFLRFYHGLTNKEIGGVMDLNYQCVCNVLYDAISRLRSCMEYHSCQG